MKIAILTLPLHTNYGGILQAYALQTVLQRMGHHVDVLDTDIIKSRPWFLMPIVYSKRLIYKLLRKSEIPVFYESKLKHDKPIIQSNTNQFIKNYISIHHVSGLNELSSGDYDCIIVGSDQIWRKPYFCGMWHSGMADGFLKFTGTWESVRRIAYAASFGVDNLSEYTSDEEKECSNAVKRFDSVSVRDDSGVDICKNQFDVNAQAVLDPTMLLNRSDYEQLINNKGEGKSKGDMLCYILDSDEFKTNVIKRIADGKGLTPFNVNADVDNTKLPATERIQPAVETWLRGFHDANFVVTDSFHACVFSIIFNKPFIAIGNLGRGMTRFTSLLNRFGLQSRLIADSDKTNFEMPSDIDWDKVNTVLEESRKVSLQYLKNALK